VLLNLPEIGQRFCSGSFCLLEFGQPFKKVDGAQSNANEILTSKNKIGLDAINEAVSE
jgi:hypothetical protein